MSKKSLFCVLLLSLINSIFIISSGCWGTKENDNKIKASGNKTAASRQVVERPQSPLDKSAKLPQGPQAQLLSPIKQRESTPPIEDAKAPTVLVTSETQRDDLASTPIAVEPARLYGDETFSDENQRVNPLRTGEQPETAGVREPLPKPDEKPALSNPPEVKKTQPAVEHPKNKLTDEPFDPVKVNGPIFAGWAKPRAALVITGVIDGYIEPCGCAGMERMKGGMSRRHALFNWLREQGWPATGLDVADGRGFRAASGN